MPIGVLLWIGWIMFWVGARKREQTRQTPPKKTSESDLVTVTAIIPEEVEEDEV
jgi:hypothetical protein